MKKFSSGALVLCLSLLASLLFTGTVQAQRENHLLPLEGAVNVRDLGGYQTRQGTMVKRGLVFRGAELSALTPADIGRLEKLPLKTIVDFRAEDERAERPDKIPATVANVVYLPVKQSEIGALAREDATDKIAHDTMMTINRRLVSEQATYTKFFQLLADEKNVPLLFHCSGGKDRTGLGGALFLSALGVDRETVIQDYLLSAEYLRERFAPLIAKFPQMANALTVKREYIEAAFEEIDTGYGGMESYLTRQLGVDLTLMRGLYTE